MNVLRGTTTLCAALAAGAMLLAGCGATPQTSPQTKPHAVKAAAKPDLAPGDAVPLPKGKVVLTISGGLVHNRGRTLALDLDQLDAMGTVSYSVDDSQASGGRATFSGPLVKTVLKVAGAEGRTMHTVALNDYAVDVPVSDAKTLPLMLATKMNGKRMTVANYGPTRFIYPTEGYHLDKTIYDPRWIWQLKALTVR